MSHHHEIAPKESEATKLAEYLAGFIPELVSERLKLRAPHISDFDCYAEIALSPSGRFIIEHQSREHAWYDFVNMVSGWLLRGHGLWTVERKDDGEVVGFALIGFEPGDHEPELGYMIRAKAEGLGFATEAAGCVLHYAFEQFGFTTLVSTIDLDNVGSQNVARKLGGHRDEHAEHAHENKIMVFRYGSPGVDRPQ